MLETIISHLSGITLTFLEVMRYYFSSCRAERKLNKSPFSINLGKVCICCYTFKAVNLNFSPTEIPQYHVLLKFD